MTQRINGTDTKETGDELSAFEFSDILNDINYNAQDAETRLQVIEAVDFATLDAQVTTNTGDITALDTRVGVNEADILATQQMHGWAHYKDTAVSGSGANLLVVPTTFVQLTIDGGVAGNDTYEPSDAVSPLWDTTTSTLNPITLGDSYMVRLDLEVYATGGGTAPTYMDLVLDIGASPDGTVNPVVSRTVGLTKNPPFTTSNTTAIFCLNTFMANGGTFWLRSDSSTVSIGYRAITIVKTSGAVA